MLIAITRDVSTSIGECELTHLERVSIDLPLARRQHDIYRDRLSQLGCRVINLPEEAALPDAVFVEDAALVLDELAVITRPGAMSRRPECDSIAAALAPFRTIARLTEPAELDGGDVFRVGRTLFVGRSARTNAAATDQLRALLAPHDYVVVEVEVRGCLHLKSACCVLDDRRVLANRAWLDPRPLAGLEIIDVPREEPGAANVLAIGGRVLLPAAHPLTATLLQEQGFTILTVDNSELLKAESGVTCSSLVFSGEGPIPGSAAAEELS